MKKASAGLLLYRKRSDGIEVLLVHPGGPFWVKKDQGAWSIPKGEYEEDEAPLGAARREFEEEIGRAAPDGDYIELGEFKRSDGKTIKAWAVEADLDTLTVKSNTFEMEWPPKSGKKQHFSEIDKAEWIPLQDASLKMHKGQPVFLERLAQKLNINFSSDGGTSVKQQQLL